MEGADYGALIGLVIGDEAEAWADCGFDVRGASMRVGETVIELAGVASGRGILGWELAGIDGSLDGLASCSPDSPVPDGEHENGVSGIDHIVVGTDDVARTTAALHERGVGMRRTRTFELEGVERQQRFFWLGPVILELVGRAEPKPDAAGPARFWGLAFTVADIESTCSALGERTSKPRPAVQVGRRISTLRPDGLGISVPVAFMSPHVGEREHGV